MASGVWRADKHAADPLAAGRGHELHEFLLDALSGQAT